MQTKEDFKKIFLGSDRAEKMNQFDTGMLELEKKYSYYFEKRSSKYNSERNDRLRDHCTIDYSRMKLEVDPDLDIQIQRDCYKLFDEILKSRTN